MTTSTLSGTGWKRRFIRFTSVCLAPIFFGAVAALAATAELKNISVNGGLEDGKARLVIEAALSGLSSQKEKLIHGTALEHSIHVSRDRLTHTFSANFDILQGEPKELTLTITGDGGIRRVTGDALQDWSVRQETNGVRTLVLRPRPSDKPNAQITATIVAEQEIKSLSQPVSALTLAPSQSALFNGYVKVAFDSELDVRAGNSAGLIPIELKFLPDSLRNEVLLDAAKAQSSRAVGRTEATTEFVLDDAEALGFRFQGSAYALPLRIALADPEARRVVLRDFKMTGRLSDHNAAFVLNATARIKNSAGASLTLLSGGVALTELPPDSPWRLRFEQGRFVLVFDRAGDFPVELKFNAAVRQNDGWNSVDFRVAPSVLQPVALQGLAADTQFQFANAAKPERAGRDFKSFLPPDGAVKLAWKEARPETEGKLFYAAEMLSQISVSPGLMRQVALLEFKVMQGELNGIALRVRGAGEVTRVLGDQVLAWNVEPVPNSAERRLVVQFNQARKDQFALQVQMQSSLGAFPQTADAMQLRPEGATRFAGYFRIVNDGAVRLEVAQASGLSQISPDQFPESDSSKALFRAAGSQRFAYRFSGADFALRIQADQILPELAVSQLLQYHLGESELTIDAEMELEIREAPLRELLLQVPKGYAILRVTAPSISDYFLSEPAGQTNAELRVVYGRPVSGREILQLRLERNQTLSPTNWALPRLDVASAKSVRGFIGVSAEAGFRLTPDRTQGLTDVATAFFPRKVAGIQAAFRLSDPAWQAALRVERLPKTVQADALHLFSIGEGIAYGSSVLNYVVSGAPVSAFRVQLSDEYFNVEFTGKDIRGWQKSTNGYVVQLHAPVSGPFTLLATYERPFKSQGETLAFTGAAPLDAQPEQGHTLVISAYQFQVQPVEVSPGLLPLETGEVPAEYRLFFDAPILAAYRYTARPFNLRLALSPLAPYDSLSQVVDRASLVTRISKEGQVLTDARYFVKNRGNPNFRLTLPAGTQLWSAMVNGASVVPVTDAQANLIPLPQRADPNAILTLDLKLAARPANPQRVTVVAPIVTAPVMLAQWKLEPDTGQRLVYRSGSLTPIGGVPDVSGFAQWARLFAGRDRVEAAVSLLAALLLVGLAVAVWRWTTRDGVYRFSLRHLSGMALGLIALVLAGAAFVNLAGLAEHQHGVLPRDVTLLAPVQQAGSALSVEVSNVEEKPSAFGFVRNAWPALLALGLWFYGGVTGRWWYQTIGWILGWALLAWAALRWPNGAPASLIVLSAFILIHVLIPALRRLGQLPRKPKPASPPSPAGGTAPAAATLAGALIWWGITNAAFARSAELHSASKEPPLAESVTQQIRVTDQFAFATAKVRWPALKGQTLPLLFEPAVLTRVSFPTNSLRLVQVPAGGKRADQLLALADGAFDIEAQYQVHVVKKGTESGFTLPTQYGLINRLELTVANLDVDVVSPQAVAVQRGASESNTVATLFLTPENGAWIAWKPRSRDLKSEKPVFYAEIQQLYVPSAGVIEGAHLVSIRPAQGELNELVFAVPRGATITDVLGGRREETAQAPITNSQTPMANSQTPITSSQAQMANSQAALNRQQVGPIVANAAVATTVSLWRFDPDMRKLRVTLSPAQSRPFAVLIRSQIATGPLPFEQSAGLVAVESAAGQIGLLGIATGNEVQLDTVTATGFSAINLEDYPVVVAQTLQGQIPGLSVRRAFRYGDASATVSLKASAVEPDVRVEAQDTLSLGEDRTVLAANATVEITRAGIFRLSFVLPAGMDVDTISGQTLSHWTEQKADTNRIVTLHLKGKTEGKQQYAITLAGPGVKATNAWSVPQIVLREANKQRGTLLIAPEQGMRLQVNQSSGVTQLDPQKSGIRQKNVLAFGILQTPWNLSVNIEQVDPWIQVTSLQHAIISEAQVKVSANLQYQIENTGLKALRVFMPTNAESVGFRGEQVADFLPVSGSVTNGLQAWEIKLHRRMIGRYLLQLNYQTLLADQATNAVLRGIQAAEVNLQRGFVTVESGGRLQLRAEAPPPALQPTEWQSIPRALQQDLGSVSANFAYRLVEPTFQLTLQLDRHEAAKLLPARVNSVTLTSVISDDGVMLTQARLEMLPGDKRLLHLTLPPDARFWFAFVNQNGVWPWRETNQILIPLEQQTRSSKAVPVELFYSSQIGKPGRRSLDLQLLAPKFDLPLENITWRVFLNEKWRLTDWTGTLQLQEEQVVGRTTAVDLQTYLQSEANAQREKTKEAEQMLAFGNSFLAQGDPQQARRAFQNAFGLSQGDQAFNEDARVQLNNLKVQQALVGLNVRQSTVAGESDAVAAKLRDLRNRKDANYTQQEVKAIIDRNSADENTAFMRLAERLIQQQDAAVSSPTAIRASVPEQGRLLTFKRAVAVDTWADLKVQLEATAARTASWSLRVVILIGILGVLTALAWAARSFRPSSPDRT